MSILLQYPRPYNHLKRLFGNGFTVCAQARPDDDTRTRVHVARGLVLSQKGYAK